MNKPRNFEDVTSRIPGAHETPYWAYGRRMWVAPCPLPGHETEGWFDLMDHGDKVRVKFWFCKHTRHDLCRWLGFTSLIYMTETLNTEPEAPRRISDFAPKLSRLQKDILVKASTGSAAMKDIVGEKPTAARRAAVSRACHRLERRGLLIRDWVKGRERGIKLTKWGRLAANEYLQRDSVEKRLIKYE